jgi:hypothetical protein
VLNGATIFLKYCLRMFPPTRDVLISVLRVFNAQNFRQVLMSDSDFLLSRADFITVMGYSYSKL